jgi:hypothetical protein
MTQRRQVTLVAAGATLLASAPLASIFATWTWAIDAGLAVAAICAAALAARALRTPLWGQVLAMLAALIIMLTWLFASSGALVGTIPTGTTLHRVQDLLNGAGTDIRDQGIPVPDRNGLLFLTTMSIGLVAILVDLAAVGLRRPALAGFPMLAIYAVPVFVSPHSVSFIPFVVGAVGFLWLLVTDNVDRVRRFGRRFTGEGRDVDLWEPSPLAAAGRRLAVVGVVLAILLPLAVPGMTSGLVDRFGGNGSGPGIGNGNGSASVNLFSALSGSLHDSKSFDMIKVTTSDPSPYYLRFGVADQLSKSGFAARPPSNGQPVTGRLPDPTITGAGVQQRTYQASVNVVNFNMSLLPVYTQPISTQKLSHSWLFDSAGGEVFSPREVSKGKNYSFDYVHTQFSPVALRSAPALSPNDPLQQQMTRVPVVPEVENTVAPLIAGKTTPYDKVLAIYRFFSFANGFSYSLLTKEGTSGSDIANFLANKQGFCEQYASAMAWLVRAAGIPARVAFGFTSPKPDGHTYTLTNYNLHAWTEVYFDGFGWVPFDATPTSNIIGAISPAWAPDVNHQDATTPGTPDAAGPNGGASTGPDAAGGAAGRLDQEGNSTVNGATLNPQAATWPWYVLGVAVLILILLALPALRRRSIRLARRARTAPGQHPRGSTVGSDTAHAPPGEMHIVTGPDAAANTQAARLDAHAAWDEFVDTLVDFQVPVDEAETPRVTAERIVGDLHLDAPAADGVRLLSRAEERARYARTPLTAVGLGGALRTVRTAIADQVSRRTWLRAKLLPPSVLRRWRAGLGETTISTVATFGRARDVLVRLTSPRRLLPRRAGR